MPFWQAARCDLRRFHQEEAQHRTALLGGMSYPQSIPSGIFQRHQSEIARHLLAARKPVRISDDQYEGQRGERTDPGMRHQALRCGTLFHLALDRLTQFGNHRVQSNQQLQQVTSPPARPRSQPERFQSLASVFPLQLLPAQQTLVQLCSLQLIHDPGKRVHHAKTMPQ